MSSYSELSKGAAWEYRVQRALFLSGWYVRRGVNLRERVQGSPQTMAEVDVLGLGFDAALTPRSLVGECKDRKGSTKEADRIVWLMGLSRLLRADHVLFAKTTIAQATVQFAKPAGVALWEQAAVREIEHRFGFDPDQPYFGSANILLQENTLRPARKSSKLKGTPLRAAWDYLAGGFWYSGTPSRTKRLKGYFEALNQADRIDPLTRSGFIAEGLIALLLSGYTTAGQLGRLSPGFGTTQQEAAIASGAADAHALREIAARADDYYQDALQNLARQRGGQASVKVQVPRLANAVAEVPDWTAAYLAFSRRLGEQPLLARDTLRYSDIVLFEELLAGEEAGNYLTLVFQGRTQSLQTSLELAALFLSRVWGVEDRLLTRILDRPIDKTRSGQPRKRAQAKGQPLFE